MANGILSNLRNAPGFVSGSFARSADGNQGRSMVLFESEVRELTTRTLDEVRNLAVELRPSALDDVLRATDWVITFGAHGVLPMPAQARCQDWGVTDLLDGEPDAAFDQTLREMNEPLIERVTGLTRELARNAASSNSRSSWRS